MTLNSGLLYNFVKDPLRQYSENFQILDKRNPVKFRLNGRNYSVHVSYVHDSGNARENDDEVRIQISRQLIEELRRRANEAEKVAFTGFFENGKIFVAWDPRHIFSLNARHVVSVYARQSQKVGAELNQAAVHQFNARLLGETSFAIALPASALGLYLENIEHFHRLDSLEAIQQVLGNAPSATSNAGFGEAGEVHFQVGEHRERFIYTRQAYPRDPRFAQQVLEAYKRTCCVCSRQLGLVQAAHIIPHSEPNSPNSVANGLALCIEHHRLYDDGLLLPGPDRRLHFNPARAEFLSETGQGAGLEQVRNLANRRFDIPANEELQPSDEYLQRGLDLRIGR